MGTVAPVNTKNRTFEAMPRISCMAKRTFAAARIDLANNAFTDDIGSFRGFFYDTNELMAKCALKARIAFRDLKIRVADAGKKDAHEGFVRPRRCGRVGDVECSVFKLQRLHL